MCRRLRKVYHQHCWGLLQLVTSPAAVAGPCPALGRPGGQLELGWGALGGPCLAAMPAIVQACQPFPGPFLMFQSPAQSVLAHLHVQNSTKVDALYLHAYFAAYRLQSCPPQQVQSEMWDF